MQTDFQQVLVEVLVSGDLDSHKLVFVAAFNGVSDGFLSPLPGAGFHLMHPDFVAYVGVEISLALRSEEHTSELQSQSNLVCRLLLEKKNKPTRHYTITYHCA